MVDKTNLTDKENKVWIRNAKLRELTQYWLDANNYELGLARCEKGKYKGVTVDADLIAKGYGGLYRLEKR